MRTTRCSVLLALLAGLMVTTTAVRAADDAKAEKPTAEKPADAAKADSDVSVSVTPEVTYANVSGNKAQFREDHWMKDGWSGGVEEFTLKEKLHKDWDVLVDGRAVFDNDDYKLRLEIVNPQVGFVRAGFTELRHDYDGEGGFFKGFAPPSFHLSPNLILRDGNIWIETGLTLPGLPQILVGYERQFRQGEKSLLEWGGVTQGGTTRNIFPSFKDIDEHVDIVKAEVQHDIAKIHLADQFRYERYASDTMRTDTAILPTATQTIITKESYTHDEFFNTFRAESHLNDKVYWSLGHLYTSLDGNGSLNLTTSSPSSLFAFNAATQALDVKQESNVVNLNSMFGPFAGFVAYLGLQAETTHTRGFTDALVTNDSNPSTANLIHTSNNKDSLEETAGVRYTKIPFTTLYAEGRWTEQDIDLNEDETDNALAALLRSTDTSIFRQDYTVGFNTAPLPRLTLASRYRHSIYNNDYDNTVTPQSGYPGFITAQDFTIDDFTTRLTWRPCSKATLAFAYHLVATTIDTSTATLPSVELGPGTVESGRYDARIYTVSGTVTPVSRLYLTGLLSWQDTYTSSFADSDPSIGRYKGDVLTVMTAAGYALDEKTDLTMEYTYSECNDFNNNSAAGLPLGLRNRRTGVLAGVSRRFKQNVIARLRYGFYEYHETSNGGINDYRANLASASCTVRF